MNGNATHVSCGLRRSLAFLGLALAASCTEGLTDIPDGGDSVVGSLSVKVETTGQNVDSNGYTVGIDEAYSRTIGINETVTFTDVPAGQYVLQLEGIASNCEATGGPSRFVTVVGGTTTEEAFTVQCS